MHYSNGSPNLKNLQQCRYSSDTVLPCTAEVLVTGFLEGWKGGVVYQFLVPPCYSIPVILNKSKFYVCGNLLSENCKVLSFWKIQYPFKFPFCQQVPQILTEAQVNHHITFPRC